MKTPFTPGLATPNRRRFLKITGSLAGLGLLSQFDTLAQAAADDDYRALVCIFMYGGNDSSNLLLPYESSEYNRYTYKGDDLTTVLYRNGTTILFATGADKDTVNKVVTALGL